MRRIQEEERSSEAFGRERRGARRTLLASWALGPPPIQRTCTAALPQLGRKLRPGKPVILRAKNEKAFSRLALLQFHVAHGAPDDSGFFQPLDAPLNRCHLDLLAVLGRPPR